MADLTILGPNQTAQLLTVDLTATGSGQVVKLTGGASRVVFGILTSDTANLTAKIEQSMDGVNFDVEALLEFNNGAAITTDAAFIESPASGAQPAPYIRLTATITAGQIDQAKATSAYATRQSHA